jgi:hypothetical protein
VPLTTTTLNAQLSNLATLAPYLSLHSADPGSTGTSETTAARQAATWGTPASGSMAAAANIAFTGGASNGAVAYVGLWSASTAGTFRGAYPVAGGSDTTFNASGAYTVASFSVGESG